MKLTCRTPPAILGPGPFAAERLRRCVLLTFSHNSDGIHLRITAESCLCHNRNLELRCWNTAIPYIVKPVITRRGQQDPLILLSPAGQACCRCKMWAFAGEKLFF